VTGRDHAIRIGGIASGIFMISYQRLAQGHDSMYYTSCPITTTESVFHVPAISKSSLSVVFALRFISLTELIGYPESSATAAFYSLSLNDWWNVVEVKAAGSIGVALTLQKKCKIRVFMMIAEEYIGSS
jgi:hypothetical protein